MINEHALEDAEFEREDRDIINAGDQKQLKREDAVYHESGERPRIIYIIFQNQEAYAKAWSNIFDVPEIRSEGPLSNMENLGADHGNSLGVRVDFDEKPPTMDEVKKYFVDQGYRVEIHRGDRPN